MLLLKTILNRIQKFPSHVYDNVRLLGEGDQLHIEIGIVARKNGRCLCSRCLRPAPGYDTLEPRRFQFIPLWNIPVFLVYSMRRVQCHRCEAVLVEAVPWAEGKQRTTHAFSWFLASWAKRLSWKQTAQAFATSWDTVARAVRRAVDWGLAHRHVEGVKAIGIDEIAWTKKGDKFATVVYQIDEGRRRLLWIGKGRKEATLQGFFDEMGDALKHLEFVASDMWKPYLNVIAQRAATALHVLDRFHIMAHFSKALDKIRAQEARELKSKGYEPVLKDSRFLLLKRPENLTDKQDVKLAELLRYNLRAVRAYLLKEDFQFFWTYVSPYWAGRFLDRWCTKTMRSRIEPMKKVARSLRKHRELLLNWFRAQGEISSGIVEGLNNKAKVTMRNAYGYRSYENLEASLYHALGDLPDREFTHRFC